MYNELTTSLTPDQLCQLALTVAAAHGTEYVWLGSASHVTLPELLTLMNLYCTPVPGARETVPDQSGLLDVYCDAPNATASAVFQLPRAVMFPESLTVSPYEVDTSSLKVMATAVAVQELLDFVEVDVVDVLVEVVSVVPVLVEVVSDVPVFVVAVEVVLVPAVVVLPTEPHIPEPLNLALGYKTLGIPPESVTARLPLESVVKVVQLMTSTTAWPAVNPVIDAVRVKLDDPLAPTFVNTPIT